MGKGSGTKVFHNLLYKASSEMREDVVTLENVQRKAYYNVSQRISYNDGTLHL